MAITINPSDQTITQYNVQTGGASNLLNNVAPSATTGVPLISQGSTSQPVFGTALVAGGGTGDTSFTAYSVITGGTTSTGALQNVSGVGTSGQVLTSNGASTLPTWQTQSIPPINTANFQLYEDFIGWINSGQGRFMNAGWNLDSISAYTTASPENPGVYMNSNLALGTVADVYFEGSSGVGFGQISVGGGAMSYTWIVKSATLSTGTNRYVLYCGLSDITGAGGALDIPNGIYFLYSDNVNSGNWVGKTASSSTRTSANSAIAATNSAFVNLTITVNAGGTSCAYFINGTQIANSPITTNIPLTGLLPFLKVVNIAGTISNGSVLFDMFTLSQTLTTPR